MNQRVPYVFIFSLLFILATLQLSDAEIIKAEGKVNVKPYDILSQTLDKSGAVFLTQNLEGSGLLNVKREKPKVMVVIDEKIMGVFGTTGYEEMNQAETTLIQKFSEMGFNIVDPKTVKANITRDKGLRLLEGDDRAAAVAALQHGAQIAVIGRAISKNAGGKLYGTRMQSIQAVVTARVIRTDDAKVIATGSEEATKAHIDEVKGGVLAIQEASEKLAETLSSKILARWEKEAYGGSQEITLVITNLVSYRHLAFIVNFLENEVRGVKNLQQRSFNLGVAELGLDYAGKLQELAKFFAMKKFTGFRLEPTNFTQNRIDLRAVLEETKPAPSPPK